MMRKSKDPYADSQFQSLWAVVCHALGPDEDRYGVYAGEATEAMIRDHRWRGYRMVFAATPSGYPYHVGYRFANPRDWFVKTEVMIDGPFRSKRLCLRVLRVKSAAKVEAGVYQAGDSFIFTRANAASVGVDEEVLP